MMLAQNLVNRIKDHFELNLYETKVWLALLSKGVASVGEVAVVSGVPRSRTYDVLESLEKKGFAIIRMGKPVKYLGVKPYMIIERMKGDVRRSAEEKVNDLSKLKETEEFIKLDELYNEGLTPVKKEELSTSLRGKINISNFLKELIKNSEKEVIICAHVDDIISKTKLFAQILEPLKKTKVKIKMALSGDTRLIKELETKLALKIKETEINSRFFIIDRKELIFYLSRDRKDCDEVAVWLNSDFFAESFATLFERAIGR